MPVFSADASFAANASEDGSNINKRAGINVFFMFFPFPDPDLLYEIPREFQACPRPRQALTQSPQICWLTSRIRRNSSSFSKQAR